MKFISLILILLILACTPFLAKAGELKWSPVSSITIPTTYIQVWGNTIPVTENITFCSTCGCCNTVNVTVFLRHPQQGKLSVYVNVNGNGMTLTSTPQSDGSLKFEGTYTASGANPTVSLHLKSNSGSSLVLDPVACGVMLSITAINGH